MYLKITSKNRKSKENSIRPESKQIAWTNSQQWNKSFPSSRHTHDITLETNSGCNAKHRPFTVTTQSSGLLRATKYNVQPFCSNSLQNLGPTSLITHKFRCIKHCTRTKWYSDDKLLSVC